jgi:dTDP-4-amino-4,6-dideoxygalactose transaminase
MKNTIWLTSPHLSGDELSFVKDAFESNWVAPLGPNVDGFEHDLEEYLGENMHVAVLSSGTAAIHLGLIVLGVQAGDEVICQSMTFSASANPIVYLGATPIFIDSEPETWNMSPEFLEKAIKERLAKGKKPKAIIPVHLYGMPAKMDEIMAIAAQYDIPVLEDSAEALGSSINGKMCSTIGDIGVLSFNGNKIITTSGGGALVSGNADYVATAHFLSAQARDTASHYQHSQIGYNYRLSNICAGIGRGQMMVLPERVMQRRNIYEGYLQKLSNFPGVSLLKEPNGHFSNRWLTTILIDPKETDGITRETLRLAFKKEQIESRPLWKPMHRQPVFEKYPYYGNGYADFLFEHGLCLPSGSNLSEDDLSRIFGVIEDVWKKVAVKV